MVFVCLRRVSLMAAGSKNFSFLYDDGWHLAPAYDLLPCGIEGDYHTTSVNDNPNPKKEDILALAKRVSLPLDEAEKIYTEIENMIKNTIIQ